MGVHVQPSRLASQPVSGERAHKNFCLFAWIVLAYNIPVILWGAFVRVSFSGDGCGANWPFCNGQVLPQNMSVPTAIEFTHRMMTSVDSFAVIALVIWAFFAFPKRHAVRRYAVWSFVFLIIEALLGAGLVLFRLVAKDQSAGRVWYLSGHLTNTMLLLAALSATAWAASKGIERIRLKGLAGSSWSALGITVFTSVTGAVTALGDTLFPATSLPAGVHQDFSASSSMLLRLRVVHPLIAVAGAAYLLWLAAKALSHRDRVDLRQAAIAVTVVTILQLVAGMVNVTLLAPLWMQITHLLIADVLWIAVVLFTLTESRSSRRDHAIG